MMCINLSTKIYLFLFFDLFILTDNLDPTVLVTIFLYYMLVSVFYRLGESSLPPINCFPMIVK